jgi:hypothetical protein
MRERDEPIRGGVYKALDGSLHQDDMGAAALIERLVSPWTVEVDDMRVFPQLAKHRQGIECKMSCDDPLIHRLLLETPGGSAESAHPLDTSKMLATEGVVLGMLGNIQFLAIERERLNGYAGRVKGCHQAMKIAVHPATPWRPMHTDLKKIGIQI